jgi:hypothetical protein
LEADFNYFRRRAQEEREAAMKAPHPLARRAHREMAERYDELSDAIAAHHLTLYAEPVSAS